MSEMVGRAKKQILAAWDLNDLCDGKAAWGARLDRELQSGEYWVPIGAFFCELVVPPTAGVCRVRRLP